LNVLNEIKKKSEATTIK